MKHHKSDSYFLYSKDFFQTILCQNLAPGKVIFLYVCLYLRIFIPEIDDGSWQWWEWNHWLSRILGSDVKGVFNNQIIITLKYYSVHWQLSLRRGDNCSLQSVWPWWWWLPHSRNTWYILEIRETFFSCSWVSWDNDEHGGEDDCWSGGGNGWLGSLYIWYCRFIDFIDYKQFCFFIFSVTTNWGPTVV